MRKLFGTILFAAGAASFFTMEGFAGTVTGTICVFIGIMLLFSGTGGSGGRGRRGSRRGSDDVGFFIGIDGGDGGDLFISGDGGEDCDSGNDGGNGGGNWDGGDGGGDCGGGD